MCRKLRGLCSGARGSHVRRQRFGELTWPCPFVPFLPGMTTNLWRSLTHTKVRRGLLLSGARFCSQAGGPVHSGLFTRSRDGYRGRVQQRVIRGRGTRALFRPSPVGKCSSVAPFSMRRELGRGREACARCGVKRVPCFSCCDRRVCVAVMAVLEIKTTIR